MYLGLSQLPGLLGLLGVLILFVWAYPILSRLLGLLGAWACSIGCLPWLVSS